MSFLHKQNTPSHDSTMPPPPFTSQTSMSQTLDTVLRTSEYPSSWEDEDLWADPAGDFEPLFERAKAKLSMPHLITLSGL
eukprot:5050542-Ditylum_brightwellii.AAC.1